MKKLCKFEIKKAGYKKNLYTVYFIIFDPRKYFVGTDEIKDILRKERHISKAKVKDEYDTVFATWEKVEYSGRKKHIEFTISPKQAANTIFVFPKKHRKDAYNWIKNYLELPCSVVK